MQTTAQRDIFYPTDDGLNFISRALLGPIAFIIGVTVVAVFGIRLVLRPIFKSFDGIDDETMPEQPRKNFLVTIWNSLPIPLKFFFSKCNETLYESKLSRLFITPYVKLHYAEKNYLASYLPAAGQKKFNSFQHFFMRDFAVPPTLEHDFVWPCEGLLCDQCGFDEKRPTNVKGETKELRAVFGAQGRLIPENYEFLNIFLHNKDYHHIHSPVSGRVTHVERIHGDLILLRPWFYKQNPSVPAMVNERVVVQIQPENAEPWWVSIVGGPAVGTIVQPEHFGVGTNVTAGEKIASFRLGSTCCLAVPRKLNKSSSIGRHVDVFSPLN